VLITLSSYQAGQNHTWHQHDCPTIFALLSGAHQDQSRRGTHEQSIFAAVFHPTTEPHATAVGPQGMIGLNVEYPEDWLHEHGLRTKDLDGLRMLENLRTRLTVLRMLGASRPGSGAWESDLETSAFELLEPLVFTNTLPQSLRTPDWLRRAEEFLRAEYPGPIRLRDVAREVDIHPVYCARVFRRCCGCSVGEYIAALRLLEAARLVVQNGCRLAQAALSAGFADQAHFSRRCARAFGFSPKAFRLFQQSLRAGP
jgi:AraC family transcriptional regulator